MRNRSWKHLRQWLSGWVAVGCLAIADGGQPRFTAVTPQPNGWVRLSGHVDPDRLITLEASSNLVQWGPIAVLDYRAFSLLTWQLESTNTVFDYVDPGAGDWGRRYYRFLLAGFTNDNDWKNQVAFPADAFLAQPTGGDQEGVRWIKFAIRLDEPFRVYYQDSQKYLLHHDFATVRLEPFHGLSRESFDQISLYTNRQQVMLGTVFFPPRDDLPEFGIQFTGRDAYPRETVHRCFELVRSTIQSPPGVAAYYFPAFEQSETAAIDEVFLAGKGIRLSSVNRWVLGDQVYAAGWALGPIKFVAAREISQAYATGRLGPLDILLTDGVPAEVPYVAGIITTAPATPSSHVAILAGAYGVPFAYVANPVEQARLGQLTSREAILQASIKSGASQVSILDVDGALDPDIRAELLAAKIPVSPRIKPTAHYGSFSASTDSLSPNDVAFFGGKAANFGVLRHAIPSNCPVAVAFSFDLWDAFMDQTISSGRTLRAEIAQRLAGYAYPPDVAAVKTNLAAIRDLIAKTARFDAAQQQAITNALAGFDPMKNIRFRSSSNAEDNRNFSAAGLYDSFSGCLADDLDADTVGPSHADPTEPNERGVFRAMQKVYASFYNDNAFLERLRHGIDESRVGMAVLAHYSTPDDVELANGVAKASREELRFGGTQLTAELVTQAGAVSVTNPEGNARPEVVELTDSGGISLVQASGLVPLGSYVMQWEDEYQRLGDLIFQVYRQYSAAVTNLESGLALDLEYKKVAPGNLIIKQVRELPLAATNLAQRYLVNQPTTYWVYQKEGSDVFANHRLKGFLTLQTSNLRLTESNLSACFYTNTRFEYRDGASTNTLTGNMSSWPGASHSLTNDSRRGWVVQDGWTVGEGSRRRSYQLTSVIPPTAVPSAPFLLQAEIRKWLSVVYATPQPILDWQGKGTNTDTEEIQLVECPDVTTLVAGAEEVFSTTSGITMAVSFLSSPTSSGPPLGVDLNVWGSYPAALSPWAHTRITGLTAMPLELRGYYSQSAQAGHRYRYATYIFEPDLEPGLPPAQRDELAAANIQLIHVSREVWTGGKSTLTILGRDGKFR